jgi:hypothetical protein
VEGDHWVDFWIFDGDSRVEVEVDACTEEFRQDLRDYMQDRPPIPVDLEALYEAVYDRLVEDHG